MKRKVPATIRLSDYEFHWLDDIHFMISAHLRIQLNPGYRPIREGLEDGCTANWWLFTTDDVRGT